MLFKEKPTETVNAKGKEEGTTTIIKVSYFINLLFFILHREIKISNIFYKFYSI